MRFFRRAPAGNPAAAQDSKADAEGAPARAPNEAAAPIAGDRGIPSLNRARSVQFRVSRVLALSLLGTLGVGLLTLYYTKALTRPLRAREAAVAATRSHAQGEVPLPSLGSIAALFAPKEASHSLAGPVAAAASAAEPDSGQTPPAGPAGVEQFLGSQPPLPGSGAAAVGMPSGMGPQGMPRSTPPKSPRELAFERRLAGPAFARVSSHQSAVAQPSLGSAGADSAVLSTPIPPSSVAEPGGNSTSALNGLLRPTVTPAVTASVLPTRRFLLAKGAFIDCTLETAIDSTLPGMTTCITATDTFSADGTVVLLERGTKLLGETRGQVAQGSARIFVLWTEARTPTGVVVPLDSPGTDELGRSGLPGEVNRHFWDRFGAAILLTVVNGAVQGAVNSQNSSGSVMVSPSTSTDVMTEILKGTVGIAPTVTKAQGDRIQVFVARDVDFRSVYTLRANPARAAEGRP